MNDRGIKKWAPFKALKEQDEVLKQTVREKMKEARPLLSEDQQEKILQVLNNIVPGQEIELTYYHDGRSTTARSNLIKVDIAAGMIYTLTAQCSFEDIIDIDLIEDYDL